MMPLKVNHWYRFNDRGENHIGLYMGREKEFECCVCGRGGNAHTFNIYHSLEDWDYETWGYGAKHLPAIMEDLGFYQDGVLIADHKENTSKMEYRAKYKLNERQYLAVLDGALVIVTTDEDGNPIRWAIFEGKEGEQK